MSNFPWWLYYDKKDKLDNMFIKIVMHLYKLKLILMSNKIWINFYNEIPFIFHQIKYICYFLLIV